MCATCGCGDDTGTRVSRPHTHDHPHDHEHPHDHPHDHEHEHEHEHETVTLEQKVLAKNDLTAERNRAWLAERGVLALNMMSSPGPGRPPCSSGPSPTSADTVRSR